MANGIAALDSNITGNDNTADGNYALLTNISGNENTANGNYALHSNTTASYNTATGYRALDSNTTGSDNTATGLGSLESNTHGYLNTANGEYALYNNTTGYTNTAIGWEAGYDLTTGNYNIDIGAFVLANASESNTIRIGVQGIQSATFIAGIYGVTAGGASVYATSDGQLVTVTSSRRFKQEIKPMDKASEAILSLRPVTFRYKQQIDPKGIPQFGLVAEDVEKVNPALVVRDSEGKPYTVRYEAVNAMLLNEFLKEHKKVQQQTHEIHEQKNTISELKKGMDSVVAQLKEQAVRIQKVSAQLAAASSSSGRVELSKGATQTVVAKK
jgi:hypothetical protein